MTDPQQYVAEQIATQATAVPAAGAPEAEVAQAAQASAGLGVTGVDVDALAAQIKAMQAQIDSMNAAQAAAADPLGGTVATIQHFVTGLNDPAASALADELAAAVQDGQHAKLADLTAKLDRHLARNAPYPGENYHYRNAVAFVSDLPDLIPAA
jgi:ABC-type transporter Mla subunit MlaD